MYVFYQMAGDAPWHPALESAKDQIMREKQPKLFTALSQEPLYKDGMEVEESAKIKYKGPFYCDFDAKEEDGGLKTVIRKFKEFLGKLEALGIDLNQVALYATGGRGFHALLPQKLFILKPPVGGMVFLPQIYKEMAFSEEILVNTLDTSIYSARRGRMLREANVQRENGRYKVSITAAEAKAMTEERYMELTQAPRPEVRLVEATYVPGLAFIFEQCSDKVSKAAKSKPNSKLDAKLLEQFKGAFPPSMVEIMSGEAKEGVGFNQLAIQLACAANALGKSKDEFLQACEGLTIKHESNGDRYNSQSKRLAELARMYDYTHESPGYSFSAGGLRSCAKAGAKCRDLQDETGLEDAEADEGDGDVEVPETNITAGMRINRQGMYEKKEGLYTCVSEVGIVKPRMLCDGVTGDLLGYEVEVYVDGKFHKKDTLDLTFFANKAKFHSFISSQKGASSKMTDVTVASIQEVLRYKAQAKGPVFTVGQEGVDMVHVRRPDGEYVDEPVYASKDGVVSLGNWYTYRLKSLYSGESGQMDCDIHMAPQLTDTPESREFFSKFMRVNSLEAVAKCLGWYSACYISPMIRKKFDQFPILQIVGSAGAGKSMYTNLMLGLHYYRQKAKVFTASGLTPFALDSTLNASSSIPLVFDELKASEISKQMHDKLKTAFRSNYNGRIASKGRVDHSRVRDALNAAGLSNRAPLSFIGEALESQTAIMHRCVLVPLSERARAGTGNDFAWCMNHREILSQLGRSCMEHALRLDLEKMADTINAHRERVMPHITEKASIDRPAFNYAVVLTGLDFVKSVLRDAFKGAFDEVFGDVFEQMQATVLASLEDAMPTAMSEGSKVLSVLSHLSRSGSESTRMRIGEDYMYFEDGGRQCIDIKLRTAYDKYKQYSRSIGDEPLFRDYEAMVNGLRNHPCVVDRTCRDNAEFKGVGSGVQMFRFDMERLVKEECVEEFDDLPLAKVVHAFPKAS